MNVTVRNVTKRFTVKGTPAVFDASFSARAGGITTLLGPSGSGKTTLLRMIAGLEIADAGEILFDTRDVSRLPVRRRGIGFVFQSFALFNHLNVRDNVAFALDVQGVDETTKLERVRELLELVQLDGYADRYPGQLSGGQRQRIGFARALASNPGILLLDEPFAALDQRVRVELRDWLVRLHDSRKLTTILVTHDQEEALELSQEVVVMDQGRVVQTGAPAEVYDHPRTPFVASFLGSANVLRTRIERDVASIGSWSVRVPSGLPDGAEVEAIVRPHNVRVAKGARGDVVGTVTRVSGLGSHVKLQVELPSKQEVTAQLPRRDADSLALAVGDTVLLDLAEARVFVAGAAM